MGQPTDKDLETYQHVFLTGPHEQDPFVLDYTHPHSDGHPLWAPDPSDHEKLDP